MALTGGIQAQIQVLVLGGGRKCRAKLDPSAQREPIEGGSGGTLPEIFLIGKRKILHSRVSYDIIL